MENENSVISKVDVRIIVSGLDIAEVVSKSVDNTQLENCLLYTSDAADD